VDADEYLFPIVRRILSSDKTNKELCSTEIQNQVMSECEYNIRKMSLSEPMYDGPMVEEDAIMTQRVTRNMFDENMERMGREISEEVNNMADENVSEMTMDTRPIRV
jgi:tRNA G26 N,N-dimethylase Trm1